MKRIIEMIESTSKEQQNTIVMLQENLVHYKDSVDRLEKELATLSFTSKSVEDKLQETIDHLSE